MISPAASTLLIDSVVLSSVSNHPIGSEAFTVSRPMPLGVTTHAQPVAASSRSVGNQRAKVQIADLLDAFKACLANDLIWIEDFRDDEVEISSDLHEVLEVFAQIRRQDVGEN